MIKLHRLLIAALSATFISTPVLADTYYDYGRVLKVKPVVDYVHVTTPVRQCEVRQYQRPRRHDSASTLLGAVMGGVIGHAIGDNDASTVAGAIIGGSIGHTAAHHSSRSVRYCDTSYESSKKIRKITGYKVKYRYKGEIYKTFVKHHPGDTIKVRVRVSPAGYNY